MNIKCNACGSHGSHLDYRNVTYGWNTYTGSGPHEYDVHCENCGEYLGHYCYGIFEPAEVM